MQVHSDMSNLALYQAYVSRLTLVGHAKYLYTI